MTVTLVFGKSSGVSDGYVFSYDTNYATARNGPADGTGGGATVWIGQNHNDGYQMFEGFVGFDYTAVPATDIVVAAEQRVWVQNVVNNALSVDIEWRGYAWSSGLLTTSDWRTPAQLSAGRLDGIVHVTSQAESKYIAMSSDTFLAAMRPVASFEDVVVTSRQRAGNTPTTDEGIALAGSPNAGTSTDPCLVYTSMTRHSLFGVLGAQARVSDGWVYLESNGAATPTITVKHRASATGTVTTVATLALGTGANQLAVPEGAQALALVVTKNDDIFVLGRLGGTSNSLGIQAYLRGSGVTWSARATRSTTMPTYGAAINQVAAAYHDVNGGTIVAFVNHGGSAGDSVVHNELSHCFINVANILNNATTLAPINGNGYSIPSLQPIENRSGFFNTWHNQSGTGMDVASAAQLGITGADPGWGYLYSFGTYSNLGDNSQLHEGRYILASSGASFSHTSHEQMNAWGTKDANGKVRVVPISSTATAFISADRDAGYGLTVEVQQHSGTSAGSTNIGHIRLGNEDALGMPDGPAVAIVHWWDAIFNPTENSLWVYYVSTANAREIRRTSIDLNTMNARNDAILVRTTDSGNTIRAIRLERNAGVQQNALLTYAVSNSGVLSTLYFVDTFNVAPTAPTLTPKSNYDASTAAVYSWTFNDPNPGDVQSAYQLEISKVSDGTIVLDTGKVASATPSRSIAGGTITNGFDYRWRVKTWDALDAAGPYSDYGLFTASAGGSVSITDPSADFPDGIITDDIPVSWMVTGTVQAAYRIQLLRGTTLVADSGWVASTATTATVAGMLSDQEHEIRVQVRNASAVVTNTASRFLTPSFATPEVPLLTVQPNPEQGYVLLMVENPAPGAPALGIPEEGFESGLGMWEPSADATLTAETVTVHRGTGAARLTATASVSQVYARDYANEAPVTPGTRYTARMWVYRSVAGDIGPAIDWFDAAHVYISTSGAAALVAEEEWTRIDATGTAPAGAATAAYGPTLAGPANGDYLIMDEVVLTIASDRPDVSSNDILRRRFGTVDDWEVLGSAGPDGSFRDYTATAGITYEYRARGQA